MHIEILILTPYKHHVCTIKVHFSECSNSEQPPSLRTMLLAHQNLQKKYQFIDSQKTHKSERKKKVLDSNVLESLLGAPPVT